MTEKLQNHEASHANESPNDWETVMAEMPAELNAEKAEALRQAAIEKIRQNEDFHQRELAVNEAREKHGNDPDYTHISWARDGELTVRIGDSQEELPVEEAVEKYQDNPYFQTEYAFLTSQGDFRTTTPPIATPPMNAPIMTTSRRGDSTHLRGNSIYPVSEQISFPADEPSAKP